MSRFPTRSSWPWAVLTLGSLLLGIAETTHGQPAPIPLGVSVRPKTPILNNGSLHTAINPNAANPGQRPFSNIAAISQDLRLVCNGIPVQPSRLITALEGYPSGAQPIVIPNQFYGQCLATCAATPGCNPASCGQPFFIINVGIGVNAPLGLINVRPWFPIDDTIYTICGWGGKRKPQTPQFFSPTQQTLTLLPPPPASTMTCCGGNPLTVASSSRPGTSGYLAFPLNGPSAVNVPVYNYFETTAGQTPFFNYTANNPETGTAAYGAFSVKSDSSASAEKEAKKDETPSEADDKKSSTGDEKK